MTVTLSTAAINDETPASVARWNAVERIDLILVDLDLYQWHPADESTAEIVPNAAVLGIGSLPPYKLDRRGYGGRFGSATLTAPRAFDAKTDRWGVVVAREGGRIIARADAHGGDLVLHGVRIASFAPLAADADRPIPAAAVREVRKVVRDADGRLDAVVLLAPGSAEFLDATANL